MTRSAIVTQATIDRAIRAAEKRGLVVTGIELTPGAVRVLTAPASAPPMSDLERWRAANGKGAAQGR